MSNPTHRDGRPKAPRPFTAQLARVLDDVPASVLPFRHRAFLMMMAEFAKPDGTCFPSIAALCARCALSRAPVCRMLRECKAGGWIRAHRRTTPGGTRTSNGYTMKLGGKAIVADPYRQKRPGRYAFDDAAKAPTH